MANDSVSLSFHDDESNSIFMLETQRVQGEKVHRVRGVKGKSGWSDRRTSGTSWAEDGFAGVSAGEHIIAISELPEPLECMKISAASFLLLMLMAFPPLPESLVQFWLKMSRGLLHSLLPLYWRQKWETNSRAVTGLSENRRVPTKKKEKERDHFRSGHKEDQGRHSNLFPLPIL